MLYILFLFFLTNTQSIFCANAHYRFDFDSSSSDSEDEGESDSADDGRARGGGSSSSSSASSSSSRYPDAVTYDSELPSAGSKRTRSTSPAEISPKDARTDRHPTHAHHHFLETDDDESGAPNALFADAEIPKLPTYSSASSLSSSSSAAASSSSSSSSAAAAPHASENLLPREEVLCLIRRIIWKDKHKEITLSEEDKRATNNMCNNLSNRYTKRASTEEIAAGEIAIKKLYAQYKIPLEKPNPAPKDPTKLRESLLILLNKGFILNTEELRQARSLLNDFKYNRLDLSKEEKTKLHNIIKTSQPRVKKQDRYKTKKRS